jgi:TPR repeat protein
MLEKGFAGEHRDDVEAYRWYVRAAELDDRVGACRAGVMKLAGREGLPADPVVAHRWLTQAAMFAEPNAMLLLGRLLLEGAEKDGKVVIPADRATAKVWLQRAAGAGNVEAKKLLESLASEPGK